MDSNWEKTKAEIKAEGYTSIEQYILAHWSELDSQEKELLRAIGISKNIEERSDEKKNSQEVNYDK